MKENKDYLSIIVAIIFFIYVVIILFLVFNKVNECNNKDGIVIQGRCVKKEVLVNENN
jgi:hypothetical protein